MWLPPRGVLSGQAGGGPRSEEPLRVPFREQLVLLHRTSAPSHTHVRTKGQRLTSPASVTSTAGTKAQPRRRTSQQEQKSDRSTLIPHPPAVLLLRVPQVWGALWIRSKKPGSTRGHSSPSHQEKERRRRGSWPGHKQGAHRLVEFGFPRRNFRLFKPTLLSPLRKVTELVFYPIIRG